MEQLILELNSPANQSSPEQVHNLQRDIQLLQREKTAWQVGLDFLHNEDATIRFYGALTLTIKINANWDEDGLSEDPSLRNHLLESVLNAYIQLTNLPDASFVLKKICGTLSTFFFKVPTDWELPIRSTLLSMLNGAYILDSSIDGVEHFDTGLAKITHLQLRGLLWLCSDLAEDAARLDSSTPHDAETLEHLSRSGENVWQLIYMCLKKTLDDQNITNHFSGHEQEFDIVKLVLQIIPLWAPFAPLNEPQDGHVNASKDLTLNKTLGLITNCFTLVDLTDSILLMLTSLLEGFPRLIRHFQKVSEHSVSSLVRSNRASDLCDSLLQGDFSPEGVHYVEFLDALIDQEYEKEQWWHSVHLSAALLQLRALMACPGVAVVEDEVCQPVLEILNKITEASLETPSAPEDEEFKGLIITVSDSVMMKCQLPMDEMDSSTSSWDADDRAKFHEFRQDAQDFLQSAFALGGNMVADVAVEGIRKADSDHSWTAFEAYLFSLTALLDSLSAEAERLDSYVVSVFRSQTWDKIMHNVISAPDRARQGAIRFVSLSTSYLQRHPDAMVPCLNFLFSSLQLKGSTTSASRAIYMLCYSQSKLLVEALPQFITSLNEVSSVEPSDRHRVYSAVAAIIQAIPTEQGKFHPLSQILEMTAGRVGSRDPAETAEEALADALDALQSLSSIGKGLRSPADTVIELDPPIDSSTEFWTSGGGQNIQKGVLTVCTSALEVPGAQESGDIIEAACEVIKSGYTEQHPSPFKFSPEISVDFLTSQIGLANPNIEAVMSCASSFLASTPVLELRDSFQELMAPLVNAYEIIFATFQTSKEVPDSSFSSSTFDFFVRLLSRWGQTWLASPDSQQSLGIVIEVALIVLADPDTLPRRSAASVIAAILEVSGPASPLSPPSSDCLATVLEAHSPRVLALLLRLLAGDCARSELEALTEPLKKFVIKQGAKAKILLREAMKDEAGVLPPKALAATTLERRMRFVAQVEGLRGARKTNEIVREFWIDCRGSGFAYVV